MILSIDNKTYTFDFENSTVFFDGATYNCSIEIEEPMSKRCIMVKIEGGEFSNKRDHKKFKLTKHFFSKVKKLKNPEQSVKDEESIDPINSLKSQSDNIEDRINTNIEVKKSITLSTGAICTRTAERDMDGFFHLEYRQEKNGKQFFMKLKKFDVQRLIASSSDTKSNLVRIKVLKNNEKNYSFVGVCVEDAKALLDFILKRKLHTFKNYSELDQFKETDEFKNGFFGEDFYIAEIDMCAVAMYEYETDYQKTNLDILKDKRKEDLNEYRKAKASEASETSMLLGLPELTGSQKQINWAQQLRARYFQETPIKNLAKGAKRATTAKWWIDNRFTLDI